MADSRISVTLIDHYSYDVGLKNLSLLRYVGRGFFNALHSFGGPFLCDTLMTVVGL